ncbi:hypothetical protein [Prochlorococcus sp. MIT 1300]|uniref:hypothetical protein n=1 Tax=Prochlorococcus sp. MIT 1300 TaxID=3096218 RepID=UPI002A74E5A1|nr:hypothetical protein [Prochlorococcus sp. MIT 1300]
MPSERIQEIVDFATTESPYRSANKGWLTNDIFIDWSSDSDLSTNTSRSAQIAKVSLFWKPITDLLTGIVLILFVSIILGLAPLYIIHAKHLPIISSSSLSPDVSSTQKEVAPDVLSEVSEVNGPAPMSIDQQSISKDAQMGRSLASNKIKSSPENKKIDIRPINRTTSEVSSPKASSRRKVVTATDLFQTKRG